MVESISSRTVLDRWVFARIKEIHSAAMRWRDELTAAVESPDIAQAVAAQRVRLLQIDAVIVRAIEDLQQLRSPQPLTEETDNQRVGEDEWVAANLTDFELLWRRICDALPQDATVPARAIAKMKECAQYLDEIVFICNQLCLTPSINDYLENVEIGHELDLEFAFGPDFPRNPEMRKRLILEVAQERAVLNSALVDSVRGVVYRLAPKNERWKSFWPAPLLVLLVTVLVALLPYLHQFFEAWPFSPDQRNTLIGNYVLWIVGAFSHVLIQALRQMRAPTVPAFAVMDNWLIWLNVKQRSICAGVLWISVGYFLMIFLSKSLDWKTMLLAGYSSDSLTDLFVQRFELAAATTMKSLSGGIAHEPASSES
jgi:hypothetical protein